jgi:hypothetical protein
LSEADANKQIEAALAGVGNSLAAQVIGNTGFGRAGEEASATLARLAGSLLTVNGIFDTLGKTALSASLAGGDIASKLADAFGGLDALVNSTSAYYQAFYTDAERTATATRQLSEALNGMGLALPATRSAFRALVDSQDLNTPEGRGAYVALIGMAPVFNEIQQSADAAAQELAAASQALERLGDGLSNEVLRLRGLLTTSSPNSGAALQAQFATLTGQARAGDASALDRLPQLSQAIEEAARLSATSSVDLGRTRAFLAGSLANTLGTLGISAPQFAVGAAGSPSAPIDASAYNPATGGSNTDRLEAQIDRLTVELEGLRADVQAGVGHGAKTARILERITPDGDAINTRVAA